jgi:hypothetical protein
MPVTIDTHPRISQSGAERQVANAVPAAQARHFADSI